MIKLFIISNSNTIIKSIISNYDSQYPNIKIFKIILQNDAENSEEKRYCEFCRVSSILENIIIQKSDQNHDRFIAAIDCQSINDVTELRSLRSLAGLLIMAFPEIQWIPIYKNILSIEEPLEKTQMTLKTAIKLCMNGYSPLFDGDGLRGILLSRVHTKEDERAKISPRTDIAFAIDEEPHYAFMNSYTAFRFGYRSVPIITRENANTFLKDLKSFPHAYSSNIFKIPITTTVVFEDLYLMFPDSNTDLDKDIKFGYRRDNKYTVLNNATLRIITTSSTINEKVANDNTMSLNEYFQLNHIRKRIKNWTDTTHSSNLLNHIKRKIFNYFGGGWIGWKGINILNLCIILIALRLLFCNNRFYAIIFIIGIFIYNILKYSNEDKILNWKDISDNKRFPFSIKRWQWQFMPQLYENHNPLWINDKNIITNRDKFWEVAHKPTAGIFGLRNKCGLPNGTGFNGIYNTTTIKNIYKQAIHNNNFISNENISIKNDVINENTHSALGMAQEIALWLLRRAERMKDTIIDVEGAIHAAVLSDVACELIDCKTPTIAIEGLKWKHYFEVLAECEFVGVTDEIDVIDRYIDIHNAMGRICRSNNNGLVREKVFNSGMAEIMDTLATLLRSKGKMEEASFFTKHSRHLHRKLMPPFMRTLLFYPEWVLFSKLNFIISLVCLFVLCWIYLCLDVNIECWNAFQTTAKVLCLGTNILDSKYNLNNDIILFFAHQMAYLHLGFIAAHFLLFINRK